MFERIVTDAARELNLSLPKPHFSANILTFLPVIIALRGWSFGKKLAPAEVEGEITEFLMRGLGFE